MDFTELIPEGGNEFAAQQKPHAAHVAENLEFVSAVREHFDNTVEEEEKDIINEKTEDDDYLPSPDMLEDFPGNKDEE